MKKPIITKLITTLHLQYGDDLLPITIYINEYNEFDYYIKYPKCGRNHYYSMVNEVDDLFQEQFLNWHNVFRFQTRGEMHKIQIPNY